MKFTLILLSSLLLTGPAFTQRGGNQPDPQQIMEKIRKEMEQIDKLLNDAARKPKDLKKLLSSSIEKSVTVEKEIDRLLQQAKSQQQQSRDRQRQRQQQQQQRRQQQRKPDDRMDQSPDHVNQQDKQGDPKNREDHKAERNKPDPLTGRNVKSGKRKDGATGKNAKDSAAGEWGDLPEYLRMLFKKRGQPSIPSKYKRFRDEFHRRVDRASKKR